MDIPRLYKYRYFNENMVSRNGLPNGEQIPQWHQVLYDGLIFPASPDTFNDPFDCEFVLENNFLNSRTAREILIKQLVTMCPLTETEKNSLRNGIDLEKDLKAILWNYYRKTSKGIASIMLREMGVAMHEIKNALRVACFSADNRSILMWSHYAQNHKGFCIEYDFNELEYKDYLKPVQYVEKRPFVAGNFADTKEPGAGEIIFSTALYKSSEWSYEQEWRIIATKIEIPFPEYKGRALIYPLKNYITAVYLGAKADEKFEKELCTHYQGTSVKVYRMQMQTDCYKLRPVQIQ